MQFQTGTEWWKKMHSEMNTEAIYHGHLSRIVSYNPLTLTGEYGTPENKSSRRRNANRIVKGEKEKENETE